MGGLCQGHTARQRYKEGSDPGLCGVGRAGGCGSRGRGQRVWEGHCGFRLRVRASEVGALTSPSSAVQSLI